MSTLTYTAEQILVIEDNKTNRELMVYLLNAFGYSTCEAENGRTGVEMARRGHPKLIVCDIQVPELDGYGVIREVKADEALREIPVVAVTALAMVGDRDRILAAGFDGYIPKPIAPETFVAEVEDFLGLAHRSTLPLSAGFTAAAVPMPTKRGTILVVDDQPVNLSLK